MARLFLSNAEAAILQPSPPYHLMSSEQQGRENPPDLAWGKTPENNADPGSQPEMLGDAHRVEGRTVVVLVNRTVDRLPPDISTRT